MLTNQQIRAITATLKRIVTDPTVKGAWGMQQRELIKAQMERGEIPTGYRVDWLRQSRDAVIQKVMEQAQQFNMQYRHDHISVQDMMDVISSVQLKFDNAIEAALKESDLDD